MLPNTVQNIFFSCNALRSIFEVTEIRWVFEGGGGGYQLYRSCGPPPFRPLSGPGYFQISFRSICSCPFHNMHYACRPCSICTLSKLRTANQDINSSCTVAPIGGNQTGSFGHWRKLRDTRTLITYIDCEWGREVAICRQKEETVWCKEIKEVRNQSGGD